MALIEPDFITAGFYRHNRNMYESEERVSETVDRARWMIGVSINGQDHAVEIIEFKVIEENGTIKQKVRFSGWIESPDDFKKVLKLIRYRR